MKDKHCKQDEAGYITSLSSGTHNLITVDTSQCVSGQIKHHQSLAESLQQDPETAQLNNSITI